MYNTMELKVFSYHWYLQSLVTVSHWGPGDWSRDLIAERSQNWSEPVLSSLIFLAYACCFCTVVPLTKGLWAGLTCSWYCFHHFWFCQSPFLSIQMQHVCGMPCLFAISYFDYFVFIVTFGAWMFLTWNDMTFVAPLWSCRSYSYAKCSYIVFSYAMIMLQNYYILLLFTLLCTNLLCL